MIYWIGITILLNRFMIQYYLLQKVFPFDGVRRGHGIGKKEFKFRLLMD